MRLCITVGIFPPDIGGPASYVSRMAAALVRRGHTVTVVCLSDSTDQDDSGYPFRVLRLRRSLFKPARWVATAGAILRIARGSDAIFANGLGFEAAVAARASGRRIVHKVVGDTAWERARLRGWFSGTVEQYQSAPKGVLFGSLDWIRAVPLRWADGVIVPSRYLARIVEGWSINRRRIQVIYNATDDIEPIPRPPLPATAYKTVMTVCRLVPWKGVEGLLRILADLPGIRLVVIGDGPMRTALEGLAESRRVADRVLFLGDAPRDHVPGYLRQAELFVLNSTYEGLPHTVLEAMAAGIPVIATDVGGTGELVTDGTTGRLVPPGDEAALRRAIQKTLADPKAARTMAERAQADLKDRFSLEAMVEQTERVLQGVSGRPA